MDGLPPEYVNASNAGRIVGVVGAFHFIALAFVSLRVYARVVILRVFGAEDALIVAAANRIRADIFLEDGFIRWRRDGTVEDIDGNKSTSTKEGPSMVPMVALRRNCAVIMGILKAVFMLTTGGSPDAIFDYWVHFWQNLQLNIGIIAACTSYLKPLFGRLLKINSSVDYYPSNERYGRSGQTPLGGGASRNTPYASGNRRTSRTPLDRSLHDEFEMHTKDEFSVTERYVSGIGTRADVVRSPIAMEGRCSAEAMYAGTLPSDTNSEEIILQKEHGRGIVCTRDFSVKYSENDRFGPIGSSKS
ncbi:hypothetical protein CCUS01_14692 [Colletotrichum cuscutae]|uniref:Integral membrane protein n=1 Tax=Colletotrichum cuscutae TaxID=1209917 RepID=A0AAI9VFZ9_9PEZI|nr:hypothetical protein CCUS01_14692 [Colletotrichum cuscutae]